LNFSHPAPCINESRLRIPHFRERRRYLLLRLLLFMETSMDIFRVIDAAAKGAHGYLSSLVDL
jgi:hypothetical protein